MNYLLFPEDEIELTRYLCNELDLKLLLNDLAPKGIPKITINPIDSLPKTLPKEAKLGSQEIYYLKFWCPQIGPIKTFSKTYSKYSHPVDRVWVELSKQSTTQWKDLIDYSQTPVIRWIRCTRMRNNCIAPGLLQGMELKKKDHPKELLMLYRQIERWLQKDGIRINPFDYYQNKSFKQPSNLNMFWVWVKPHAVKWIEQHKCVYPWNA